MEAGGAKMNEKIMIVDDEREIADLIELYLTNEGFEVYKFYAGQDALRCAEERLTRPRHPGHHAPGCGRLSRSAAASGKSIPIPS